MLAYASTRPIVAERRSAPNAMLAIIAAHVALVAVVMSAKMDLPTRIKNDPIFVKLIEDDPAPPEVASDPQPRTSTTLTRVDPAVPTPTPAVPDADTRPIPFPDVGTIVGPAPDPGPAIDPVPTPASVHVAARLITPASELRPPYPATKLASGEEATLTLRLSIDERGRVVAVEPVGRADRAFVDAARRYMLAHWRYKPATEDGRSVGTSLVVKLRFELEG